MLSPDIAPASMLALSRPCTPDLARSLLRLAFRNGKRTGDAVDSEYSSGVWDRVLNERAWMMRHGGEATSLVELGSWTGHHLFSLSQPGSR
ncbi:hypothetical protein I3J27_25900 [Bradyrhizobium xenonodulans]|uniref:Methyltransferase n=1 Tax=Bradyrhizobium xenonodulans TaxID=2736875 RepID=A0ABY7MDJ0_9BRAD|nr:hypothetical protein [Bradyrhizobium xenonodulans]WBL76447.1 hypothetical protein I3J27_25900 [Bradyrhizobium xenonodulans]